MIVKAKLENWGNSLGVRIPRKVAEELNIDHGDRIIINICVGKPKLFGICSGSASFKREKDRRF